MHRLVSALVLERIYGGRGRGRDNKAPKTCPSWREKTPQRRERGGRRPARAHSKYITNREQFIQDGRTRQEAWRWIVHS
jgi:hypothetical protein